MSLRLKRFWAVCATFIAAMGMDAVAQPGIEVRRQRTLQVVAFQAARYQCIVGPGQVKVGQKIHGWGSVAYCW